MSVQRYGTYLLLLRLYNESPLYSTEKVLARYLLKNFDQMKQVNIYDISTDCNVSRATVRRFFSKLNYESFLDFKNEFTVPYDISMFEKELKRESYITEHINQLNEIPSFFLNNQLNVLDKIRNLTSIMYESENIYWLTSSSTTRMAEDMQMQFLRLDCLWDVIINYSHNMGLKIKENDLVIVLSISSVLADSLVDELKHVKCPIYVVTLNKSYDNEVFTEFIRLCNDELYDYTTPKSEDAVKQEVVYRRYSTNLFFDFLYYEYTMLYKSKGSKPTKWH